MVWPPRPSKPITAYTLAPDTAEIVRRLVGETERLIRDRNSERTRPVLELNAGRLTTFANPKILSAKYGLVDPDTEFDNYDVAPRELHPTVRDTWGRTVLAQFDERFPNPQDMVVEVHACAEYRSGMLRVGRLSAPSGT